MKEESEGLRGDRDRIKFIALGFERGDVVGFGKEEGKSFHKLRFLGMNADLWDRFGGLGSESWKGCE